MGKIEGSLGRGPATASFEYNFATHGGAVSAITLSALSGKLPDNALITGCYTECVTAMTSGGAADLKLGITGNDNAFEDTTAYTDNSYDTADTVDAKTAELPLKVNSATGVDVLLTVGTAALTAGRVLVHVEYMPGQ
jgi:predicted outer membrane repeat protein